MTIEILFVTKYVKATRNINVGDKLNVIKVGYNNKSQKVFLVNMKNPIVFYEHEVNILR